MCPVQDEAGGDHSSQAGWPWKLCGSHGKRYPESADCTGYSGNGGK